MSALNKITDEIMKQANGQAEEILSEAKAKADEILEQGKADCAKLKAESEKALDAECREIMSRAESADRQKRRRALLEARNRVIDETIAEAKAKIKSMPDKEYFEFLLRLFRKNAQPYDGVVHVSPADYSRIPDDFLQRLEQASKGHAIKLSGDLDDASGGFIIQYENITQTCTVEGIFKSEAQPLRDRVHEILAANA